MSKQRLLYPMAIGILLLGVRGVAEAGDGKHSPESDLAVPGASLYESAVTESVRSLMSKEEQVESRPPSPGPDYFWCENCKTYHKKQAPASAQHPVVAQRQGTAPASPGQPNVATALKPLSPGPDSYWCEQCKTYHKRQPPAARLQSGAAPGTIPPSPGPNYYWCQTCKSYHLKQAGTNQAGAPHSSLVTPASPAATAVGSGAGQRPTSPGPGYYWCENCQTYHLRPTSAQQPGAPLVFPHAPGAASAVALTNAQAQSGNYYYCEQCKMYHLRQSVAHSPVVNRSPIFGGASNTLSPLLAPGAQR